MNAHVHTNRVAQITDHSILGYCILFAVFVGSFTIAPLLANKIIAIGSITVPAGILAYSVTFPVTDITAEVYGERYAKHIVFSGFVAMLVVFALTQVAILWPGASFWTDQEAFGKIFGTSTPRMFIASVVAYLGSQYLDVFIFAKLRAKTDGKWIWLRNNVSTCISKFVDMVSFCLIAFVGVFETSEIISIILGGWFIHVIIAAVDTPLVYLGIWGLRRIYPELQS